MTDLPATVIGRISNFFRSFADNVKDIAGRAGAEAAVKILRNTEPPYSHITRAEGFPNLSFTTSTGKRVVGYASQEQFNYVHASVANGSMVPGVSHRTHQLSGSFDYAAEGNQYKITNSQPYAGYVVGNMQTTMHALIGWRKVLDAVASGSEVIRAVAYALNNWMKQHNKK